MREVILISFGIGIGYLIRHMKAERDEAEQRCASKTTPAASAHETA